MIHYHARDLLLMTNDQVWNLPDGPITLTFDSGEQLVTTVRKTIFSSYIWAIHRQYPKTPLEPRHHVATTGIRLSAKSHLDLLSHAIWDCYDAYATSYIDLEVLAKHAYDITDEIYNDFTLRLEAYVTSISALDFVECLTNPAISKLRNDMFKADGVGEFNPDSTNSKIQKVLMTDVSLNGNAIAQIARSGLVRSGQIIQCIGARGKPTDIDSHIFRKPILSGFATGLTNLADLMMESRSASMSLYFTKDPMKKSEYFNRNIQLSCATLSNLHLEDCGSRNYLPVSINNGSLLKDMVGICYYDEGSNSEKIIRKESRHLIGTVVKIRSVFTCQHPDRSGVCVRCFGELGLSIPRGTNLGHVCSSETQSKVGQLLLSNKHYVGSASADKIFINDYDKQFITTGKGDNYIYINPYLNGSMYSIVVAEAEAANLSDIHAVDNVASLVPYRLSEITNVSFICGKEDNNTTYPVCVSSGVRTASLSRDMLKYLKKRKWELDSDGNYVINMDEWDVTKPFMELPLKHFSTLDYMLQIEGFIKGGSTKGRQSIMKYETPIAALMAFYDLVSLKLDVHLSYLQAIVLSTMVQSRPERDYRLPLPRESGTPAHYKQLMDLRSLAPKMAYQGQLAAIYTPASYLIRNRPQHPLDFMLLG